MTKKRTGSTRKATTTQDWNITSRHLAAAMGFRPEHFNNKSAPQFDAVEEMFQARWETHHLAQKIVYACEKGLSPNKHKGKNRHLSAAEEALIYLNVEALMVIGTHKQHD